jgi:hypothetical protein
VREEEGTAALIASLFRPTAVLSLVLLISLVSLAAAAEVTRDSYREAVEPICRQNTNANERIFKGVRAMVRHGELKRAAARFAKAARALKGTVAELRVVPRPPADESRLGKWLDEVSLEATLLEAVAAKLRAGNVRPAERMVARLSHQAVIANNQVIAFEFRYCHLEPARFT